MKPRQAGLAILVVHLTMILAIGAKYRWEVASLPRAWVRARFQVIGDSKYLQLQPCPEVFPPKTGYGILVRLRASDGKLVADAGTASDRVRLTRYGEAACLQDALTFYLGNQAPPAAGSDVWVELSVPENQLPRPLRVRVGPGQ